MCDVILAKLSWLLVRNNFVLNNGDHTSPNIEFALLVA